MQISQRIGNAANPADRADGNRKQRGSRSLIGRALAVQRREVGRAEKRDEILLFDSSYDSDWCLGLFVCRAMHSKSEVGGIESTPCVKAEG